MPITEDRVARLREFGLSEYAARAYLALLDLGVSEASEISKLTKVPTSKIYHVLDQLHEKGLAEILPEFPKKYAPVPFVEFLDKVRREHAEAVAQIERERDDLASLFSVVGNVEIGDRGNFTVVRGRRNVFEKTAEMIESARESILVVGTAGTVARDRHHREEIQRARARGVAVRYLVPPAGSGLDAFASLAKVADVRERDVGGAPRSAGVGIVVSDARQAFIVDYLPDDASVHSGKDVGIFTDHAAIVAALEAVLGPAWPCAATYDEAARRAAHGGGPAFVRTLRTRAELHEELCAALDRGADHVRASALRLDPDARVRERVAEAGVRARFVLDVADVATAEACLADEGSDREYRHHGRAGHDLLVLVDDREAFCSVGRAAEAEVFLHTNVAETIRGLAAGFERTWEEAVPLAVRRRELADPFPPKDLDAGRLLGAVRDAAVVVDDEGRVALWNPAATALFGVPAERAVGTAFGRLVPGADLADLGRPVRIEAVRDDGGRVPVELSLGAIAGDAGPRRVLATLREASDASQALALAQHVARVGSWELDVVIDRMTWSDELRRILDLGDEAPAREAFLARLHPDDRESFRAHVAAAVAESRPFVLEHRVVRRNGSVSAFVSRGEPVHGAGGRVVRVVGTCQDATDAVLAADAERRLEEGFRRAFEDAGIGKAIVSPDGRIVHANAAFARILSLPPGDVLGAALFDVLRLEEGDLDARFRDAVERGVACRFEARVQTDEPMWARLTVSCIRDAGGRPAQVVVQVDDVTAPKTAEEELRRTLSLLTATLESTADGILVVDREGRVVSHNQRFLQIWRVAEPALVGARDVRTAGEFLQQLKDAEAFTRKIRESDERPEAETFDIVEFRDGRVFERHSQPQRVGSQVVGRVWCFRDVTGQRRVEQALRQAEVYYRGLVQSARAVFWRADPATSDFTFVSREAENLLGFPVGRWLSETGFWADRIHPEDRDWVLAFRRQSTRERRAHEYEYRMTADDGRTVWVRDIVRVAVRDDRVVELVGVMIDITDRKEAEESLRDHSDRLSELVTTQRDIAHGKLALDDLLTLACVRAQRITKADAGLLGVVRDGEAVVAAASGHAAHLVGRPLDAFAALALKTGETLRSDDAEIDPRVDAGVARETKARALAVVPLKRGDQVVGVLKVASEKASAFGERDLDMLGILGGLVTAALGAAPEVTLKPSKPARTERKAPRN